MATDGVKIIDGDTAFDLYSTFMDAYDEGTDGEELRQMYNEDKQQYSFDDFEYELCVTVYAFALWEIGEITPEILQEVETVIAKGAGVADWTDQVGEKAGKARQKELTKLWEKINKPKLKIRKRQKYAKVTNLIFNPGDVLIFRLPDDTYGLTIVIDLIQYRGECDYMLCRTTFNSEEKPTLEKLSDLRIVGSLVPSGHNGMDTDFMEKMQNLSVEDMKSGALDQLMAQLTANMPKLKMPWVLMIQHKMFVLDGYAQRFEKIGSIPLRCNSGSSRFAPDYKSFCEGFYIQDFERNYQPHTPETGEFTIDELMAQPYHS